MPHDYARNHQLEPPPTETYVPAVVNSYTIPSLAPAPTDPVGLNELTAALWRGKWIIAAMMILGLAAGLGVSRLRTPTYRARTSLQLEGFSSDQFLRDVAPVSPLIPNAPPESYLQNEVKLLESETLAKRVADKLDIQPADSPRFGLGDVLAYFNPAGQTQMSADQRRVKNVQDALT